MPSATDRFLLARKGQARVNLTEQHEREDEHEGEGLRREHVRDGRADQQADALPDDYLDRKKKKSRTTARKIKIK